jgi:TonB family protein
MRMRVVLIVTFFLMLVPVAAQEMPDWTRLESDSKDFSISVPSGYQVVSDSEGYESSKMISRYPFKARTIKFDEIKRVMAYMDGASFLVESYRVNKLEDALGEFYMRLKPSDLKDLSLNSFQGRSSTQTGNVSYVVDVVVGSKDHLYRVFGVARSEKNEVLRYFLASIKLDGAQLFTADSPLDGKIKEQPVSFKSLKESPFTFENSEIREEFKGVERRMPVITVTRVEDPDKLLIAYKINPRYTPEARRHGVTGRISLRVTFGAGGQVEKVVAVSGLPDGLTEEAVKAARLMRFLPEIKDNKPVTVEKVIQYGFAIY